MPERICRLRAARVHASSPSISLSLVATTDMITLMPGVDPGELDRAPPDRDHFQVGHNGLRVGRLHDFAGEAPHAGRQGIHLILRTKIPGAVQPNENTAEA